MASFSRLQGTDQLIQPLRRRFGGAMAEAVLMKHRWMSEGPKEGIGWLLVATMPNTGSTVFAELLKTAPRADTIAESGEGVRLLTRGLSGKRFSPKTEREFQLMRAVWLDAAQSKPQRPLLVVEKSPPNLRRLRPIVETLSDMPVRVLGLTRDPYAVCASWAKRYGAREVAKSNRPEAGEGLDDEAFCYRVMGEAYVQGLERLEAHADLMRLTVSYEAMTDAPEETATWLEAAVPRLQGLKPRAEFKVKDYPPQPLSNMNARQTKRLSLAQRAAINEGLAPKEDLVRRFGYVLN
jgi:hypothetical protein